MCLACKLRILFSIVSYPPLRLLKFAGTADLKKLKGEWEMKRIATTVLFSAGFVLLISNTAAAIPCGLGGVSGSIACQDGIANNDFVSDPLAVNTENFFGFNDWVYLQKQDLPSPLETNIDVGLVVTPTTASDTGEWSFSSIVWDIYEDAMIVLKAGPAFSGYRLDFNTEPTSGTWDTGGRDLSHLTLYARGDSHSVPEPATFFLFGAGLVGLVRFKKTFQN